MFSFNSTTKLNGEPLTDTIIKSALYIPGDNAKALAKAAELGADAIIIDLEDAVAPDAKQLARQCTAEALTELHSAPVPVAVRINGLDSPFNTDDTAWLATLDQTRPPHAIVFPKIGGAAGLSAAAVLMDTLYPENPVELWAMLETPKAVLNAREISEAGLSNPRFTTSIIGINDLAKDSGIDPGDGRARLLPWLLTFVAAAKAGGLTILDGVCNDFRDTVALEAECVQGRSIGMDGKTLIHPAQIEICNRIFFPSEDEIARARRIVAAFAEPGNTHKGVLKIDGAMVERLHLATAEAILERAGATK